MKNERSRNRVYLFLFILSGIGFFLFRFPYREFVYGQDFFDFHIADTAPNFFAVGLFVFFHKWYSKEPVNNLLICSGTFLGLVVYEFFIQQHIYPATIDFKDVVASLLAASVCYWACSRTDSPRERSRS